MTLRPIVLSGFMATGKSTVGRLVAEELGVPFIDTDAELEKRTGQTVPTLFTSEGEGRFRDRELELILPMLEDSKPRVISFGGGSATIGALRHAALERATVVTLTASAEAITRRVQSLAGRPNLIAASPLQRTRDLLNLRREVYAECHASISTEELDPAAIASKVVDLAQRDLLAMPLGTRTYSVELCRGQPDRLSAVLQELHPSSIVVVTDTNVRGARGAWLQTALSFLGVRTHIIEIAPGERHKTLETVSRIWDEALRAGADRDAVVVAFGGGVVGDLAGFASSTLLRGVRCVQVATTLLSMVDSSVGGKTGFDLPSGKNLIGSFFQPQRVILDVEHLTTLSVRERRAGLAEVAKIALIEDASLLGLLEQTAEALAGGDLDAIRDVVRRSVQAKIRVVRDDERETGRRAHLNLGHTIGHALETAGGYSALLHGEGVAIGTVLEMRATERLGHTPVGLAARAAALLERLGLPTGIPETDLRAAWPHMAMDKKRAASAVKLPVVVAPGEGTVVRVPLETLERALLA